MSKCIVWLFGRGASAACGLTWTVPKEWGTLDRDRQVEMIKLTLKQEMDAPYINTKPYKDLLVQLKMSKSSWHHRFITTNWDYLLEREIEELGLSVTPHWLPETHVFHLNGTVEEFEDLCNFRSPFLLETDSASVRQQTIAAEANIAINYLILQKYFIVIGMSFSCEMDRSILGVINRVQDDLIIGESTWLIVNRSEKDLQEVASHIQSALPRADVSILKMDFASWINGPLRELQALGVLNP
jgi:hypothetical protein